MPSDGPVFSSLFKVLSKAPEDRLRQRSYFQVSSGWPVKKDLSEYVFDYRLKARRTAMTVPCGVENCEEKSDLGVVPKNSEKN